jgi:Holliday junction resolvasome RuvABC endonuclease subunit
MLIGIDGGLAHMGIATMDRGEIVSLVVIETEKSEKKREVRGSEDIVRRAREVWDVLDTQMTRARREGTGLVVCMETLSLPRNAGASAKIGVALGIVVGCAALRALPIVQASPQEVKKKIAGVRNASKDDVKTAVRRLYPSSSLLLDQMRKGDQEHAADAVAVIHACLDSDVVRAAGAR